MDDSRHNRRRFFRRALRDLLWPVVEAVERQVEQVARGVPLPVRQPHVSAFLRPPGALAEPELLDTCSRCGQCVAACPASAIKLDGDNLIAGGAPYVMPAAMPCVVCDSLACMRTCPSGALRLVPVPQIDMGLARWDAATCTRSAGDHCSRCVDQCPLGDVAIRLDGPTVQVREGCIGCGVCEWSCPTRPRSIAVVPPCQRDGSR